MQDQNIPIEHLNNPDAPYNVPEEDFMKNTAWQDGDDEIYTIEKNHNTLYVVILVVVIIGFIAGEIILQII